MKNSNRSTSIIRPFILATSLLAGVQGITAQESSVLDLFPDSGLESSAKESSCTFTYKPSGSKWKETLNEEDVFLASIQGDGWQLGVGKGGHLYSLRGVYGESVAPQRIKSPWNDEVWQVVATNEDLIGPIHEYQNANKDQYSATEPLMYFIHQAGIYTPGASGDESGKASAFYSPCLRKEWDPKTKTLRLVNWMQQAHTPCVWKSGVLVYSAIRDLGDGIIEINQIMHNFGPETLGYFSAPWGGIRKSSMPHTLVTKADGTWAEEKGLWDWSGVPERPLNETAGWETWVKTLEDEKSPALAFVFGKGKKANDELLEGKRILLWGSAGVNERDYQVTEISAQLPVKQGESLSVRWYLASGDFAQVRKGAAKTVDQARVTRISFEQKDRQALFFDQGKVNTDGKGERFGSLSAFPVKGTYPVFLLTDKRTGEQTISADLYALAETEPFPNPLPKDHKEHFRYENRVIYKQYAPHIGYENLLGYASVKKPEEGEFQKITAPKGVKLHKSAKDLWMAK